MSIDIKSIIAPPDSLTVKTLHPRLRAIDASLRPSVFFFTFSALVWLILGTAFALISSMKMTTPDYLSAYEWATFGRMRAAHVIAVMWGWGHNIVFALAPWILARITRREVRSGIPLLLSGVFWNGGLILGLLGMLQGNMSGIEWFDMPVNVYPILGLGYAGIFCWGILPFAFGLKKEPFIAAHYIWAAFLSWGFIFVMTLWLLFYQPSTGALQHLVSTWGTQAWLNLWLVPMAIAVSYYFLTKLLMVPVYSRNLALVGFWMLWILGGFSGVADLAGGPFPAWIISMGIVAAVMLLIPVFAVCYNLHMSIDGAFKRIWISPALRFILVGLVSYSFAGIVVAVSSLRSVAEFTLLTHFTVGEAHLFAYSFFSMSMFGAFYYMYPRMVGRDWPGSFLIRIHFWSCTGGIVAMLLFLFAGGILQGTYLNAVDAEGQPVYVILDVVRKTAHFLHGRTLSGAFMALGHIAFILNVCWISFLPGVQADVDEDGGPTLLGRLS